LKSGLKQAAGGLVTAAVLGVGLLAAPPAAAQERAWIVVDAASGSVVKAHRPQMQHYPASLTKMMTLYMVFEAG
jgi:D-alanyl-D-alanine carboxypeptidase